MEIQTQNEQLLDMLHALALTRQSITANLVLAIVYHFGSLNQRQNNEQAIFHLKKAHELGYPWQISLVKNKTTQSDAMANVGVFLKEGGKAKAVKRESRLINNIFPIYPNN